ncbi:hypothetical protein GCM10010256_83030 [Streptomyces coeruleorubidus]|nr:hypothetical protein GCM10010256_83030 [Streptomyces coeruleorubidus]
MLLQAAPLKLAGTLHGSAIGTAAGAVSYEGPRGLLHLGDSHVRSASNRPAPTGSTSTC